MHMQRYGQLLLWVLACLGILVLTGCQAQTTQTQDVATRVAADGQVPIVRPLQLAAMTSPMVVEFNVQPPGKSATGTLFLGIRVGDEDALKSLEAAQALRRYSATCAANQRRLLLQGPAGCGKTTGLMWVAYKFACENPGKLVLWFNGASSFPVEAMRQVSLAMAGDVAIFVDNFGMHALEVKSCILRSHQDTLYVLADRTNQVPTAGSGMEIVFDKKISMSMISNFDIDQIIKKLEIFGPWDRLGKMSQEQRRNELRGVAKKQLLVGLREVTAGVGYDKIAASEFGDLRDDQAKASYMLVAIATMHRLSVSRATFDLAILALTGVQRKGGRLHGLEDIVFEHGDKLSVRHQILADFTVRRIIPKHQVLAAVDAIIYALSRFSAPIRKFAQKPEVRLFAAITNHDFLWGMFRAEKIEALTVFSKWEHAFSADALFWLQYALFEEKCGDSYLQSAANHIRMAHRIYPSSYQVINAYANIHFALALSELDPQVALLLMEQASDLVGEEIKSPTSGAYAAVALYYGRIRVLKRHFPDRIKGELRLAEERLRAAFARDKDNTRVQEALNALNLEAVSVDEAGSKPPIRGVRRRRK